MRKKFSESSLTGKTSHCMTTPQCRVFIDVLILSINVRTMTFYVALLACVIDKKFIMVLSLLFELSRQKCDILAAPGSLLLLYCSWKRGIESYRLKPRGKVPWSQKKSEIWNDLANVGGILTSWDPLKSIDLASRNSFFDPDMKKTHFLQNFNGLEIYSYTRCCWKHCRQV